MASCIAYNNLSFFYVIERLLVENAVFFATFERKKWISMRNVVQSTTTRMSKRMFNLGLTCLASTVKNTFIQEPLKLFIF